VQTTLLSLAVAIILALVTALVGPLLVDWGRWRTTFEAEATRLVGMPVRVSGRIDARLLPTPSLQLNGIEVGAPGREPKLRARSLAVEFGLGPLLRGQWRAAQLRLDAPEVTLGVDADGRIDVPQVSIAFDPDQLAFEQVAIENGRIALADGASGTRATLEQLSFKGEVRSLIGPFKGEGAFVSAGQLYGYRLAGSRRGDEGGQRMRLNLDPADQPLTIETDGTASFEGGHPRYEGNLVLTRPAGFALRNGRTITSDPWRETSKITATPASVLFEQLELQYGTEDRAIKLGGTAELKFGAKARFDAVLSARQIDIDRAVLAADAPQRTPVALLHSMTETLSEFTRPSIPVKIGLGIDTATLAGATILGLRGDIRAEAGAWSIDTLEFRAPGATQVRASGSLKLVAGSPEFAGPASIDSADPKTLIAWLEGRLDAPRATIGALRLRGDVTLGAQRLAVEDLRAEFDRKTIEGRLAYVFAADQRPARLDAALTAREIDIDGALAFADKALAGSTFERPGEIALALDFGRARYAGIEAKGATANLKFDSSGLVIERLAVADFGGAVLKANGRIDASAPSWRGSITLGLEAQRLTGVAALAARFAPGAADTLQTLSRRAASAKLTAKLDVAPATTAADAKTSAKLALDGTIAGVRVKVVVEGNGVTASPRAADIRLDGRLDADEGAALAALVGLDRLAVVDQRPARLTFAANGPAGGDLRIDAKLTGAGLDVAARGTLSLADAHPRGAFDLNLTAADARLPRRNPGIAMPVSLGTRVSLDGERLDLGALDARIAGARLKGQLGLTLGSPTRVEGRLEADTIDAAAVIGAAIGAPMVARRDAPWSPEPFVAGPLADVEGRLDFSVANATLASGLTGRQLRGTVRIAPGAIMLDKLEGVLAEGRFIAQADVRAAATGVSTRMQVSIVNADLAALLPRAAAGRASGRVTLGFDASGAGLSPAALIGALQGHGTASVEHLLLTGLDPNAIDAAARAAERGVSLDGIRIGDIVRTALDDGRLNIPDAGGTLAISGGRLMLVPLVTPAQGADVAISGSYDLSADVLDARFDLTGAPRQNGPSGQRPALSVALKGPLEAPRRSEDVTALVNWLTLRSVEREAKRVEAAERAASRVKAQEEAALRRAQEAAAAAAAAARVQEAAAAAAAAAARADQTAGIPVGPRPDRAPDLPPTVDITTPPVAVPAAKPRQAPTAADRGSSTRSAAPPLVITPPSLR
jgi:large subunit ribosomal protein L24